MKRLIRIESNYYYDPFGRRLWKEVNGVRTYFVYADEGLVAEVNAAGNVIKSYGYKPGSTWTTDPLFMKSGGQYYFYQNDHLGTPQKLTAVNGAVVWSAKYSSFGEATVDISSTIVNNLRFPGQYLDHETGLHYNHFRYFNPSTGRYLRTDPIKLYGGHNLFSYAMNNPLFWIDPLGLKELYIWDYIPDYKYPVEAWGHRTQLRYKFAREYERRLEGCHGEYIKKLKICWRQICNNQEFDLNSCEFRAEFQYEHCKKRAEKFKYLSENYSWGQGFKDVWFYSVDENFERYKEEIDNPAPDPMENWKSPQRKYWEDVYF